MLKKFFPALLANLSATLSEILLMASSAWLIASAALHPPLSSLSLGITLVRAAGISRAVLRYADRFLSHKTVFKFLDELREDFFICASLQLPLKSGKIGEGDLLHILTVKADLMKDFLPRVVLPVSTAIITTLLIGYFLSQVSIFAAVILFVTLTTVIILSLLFNPGEVEDSDYRSRILDFNDARDEIRIFGTTPAVQILNRAEKIFNDTQNKIQARQMNFDTLINLVVVVGFCTILWNIYPCIDRIELTVWTLILLAVNEIYSTLPNAVRTYKKISVKTLATMDSPKPPMSVSSQHAVEFNNVTFGYDNAKIIFKNFNLVVEVGENLAVVGESGIGKTTLLYLMMKLFTPDEGTVSVNGKIAAVTSTNYIFSESVRANFSAFHGNISDEEILAALKICQLENLNLDLPIGENAAKLSGGERVRLQIALALAKNPDILILDEPTAGLDRINAENLMAAVISECNKKNRTLIIITHDLTLQMRQITLSSVDV